MTDANGWCAEVRATVGDLQLDVQLGEAGEGSGDRMPPVALIGPNGSGKTTFLRALTGALPTGLQSCLLRVGEAVLHDTARGVSMPPESRRIGYVAQGYALFPHLNALDNVAFGLSVGSGRATTRERRARAAAMLDELGCADVAHRSIDALSGGERQRVALARALVIEPRLLLLDEPLAALDAVTRREVRAVLAERLAAFARPTLVVTHDARDVDALGAQVVALEAGRVLQTGTAAELRRSPASAFVAEFFGG